MSSLSEKDGIDLVIRHFGTGGVKYSFLRYVNLAILQMIKFTLFYIL